MKLSEKDMEDQIWNNPGRLIGESGLVCVERQLNLDGYRIDLLLEDSSGSHLLIEIQKGGLDRTHIWKILDYGYRLKKRHEYKSIRLMVIANQIRESQIETLNHLNVEYRQISESQFAPTENALGNNHSKVESVIEYVNDSVADGVLQEIIFDRGIDARYFGFTGNRAIAASLYARKEGSSQAEVNTFMSELTNQKGFYNMLNQANQWGHSVSTWYDPDRGKVFKLIYNPDHIARNAVKPPENWEDLNKCSAPLGVVIVPYLRRPSNN